MSELALKLIAENKRKHAKGRKADRLSLGNIAIEKLPKEISELIWVEKLDFKISGLKISFSKLRKLKKLKSLSIIGTLTKKKPVVDISCMPRDLEVLRLFIVEVKNIDFLKELNSLKYYN
ncbi:MAG: hypothetical protein IPN76_12890 [Saprospiraceae bacterium]|nr:hypothetical protein [Saprospiraceae bacterium]